MFMCRLFPFSFLIIYSSFMRMPVGGKLWFTFLFKHHLFNIVAQQLLAPDR